MLNTTVSTHRYNTRYASRFNSHDEPSSTPSFTTNTIVSSSSSFNNQSSSNSRAIKQSGSNTRAMKQSTSNTRTYNTRSQRNIRKTQVTFDEENMQEVISTQPTMEDTSTVEETNTPKAESNENKMTEPTTEQLVEGPSMSIFTQNNLPVLSLTLQHQLLLFATRKHSKFVVRDTPEYQKIVMYWKIGRTYFDHRFENTVVIRSWRRSNNTSSKVNSSLMLYLSQLLTPSKDCIILKNIKQNKTQQSLMKSTRVHQLNDESFLITV